MSNNKTIENRLWFFYQIEKEAPQKRQNFINVVENKYPNFKKKWEEKETKLNEHRKKGVIL